MKWPAGLCKTMCNRPLGWSAKQWHEENPLILLLSLLLQPGKDFKLRSVGESSNWGFSTKCRAFYYDAATFSKIHNGQPSLTVDECDMWSLQGRTSWVTPEMLLPGFLSRLHSILWKGSLHDQVSFSQWLGRKLRVQNLGQLLVSLLSINFQKQNWVNKSPVT